MQIVLTADEGIAVAAAAVLQQMRAAQKGWQGSDHGTRVTERGAARRMGETINGMMAEYALCKALNVAWEAGVKGLRTGDVSERLFVRSSDFEEAHLLVTAQEAREFPSADYALMIGAWPHFRFVGWAPIADLCRPDLYRARGERSTMDAYWIPQDSSLLRDFASLQAVVENLRAATSEAQQT